MNAITTTNQDMTLAEVSDLAAHFARSGFFKDAGDASKAIVKIVAGRELGVGPLTAMTGIHIVEGKPVLSAGLIGALVLRSGRYTYRVVESTDAECRIAWERDGREIGESAFTLEDAKRAGVAGKQNWSRYPSDMLFARALTRGARRFCPDVFLGSVYVADELDAAPHGPATPAPAAVDVIDVPGGRNGNGHAAPLYKDIRGTEDPASVDADGPPDERPAPGFHATPLIEAMTSVGDLAAVMRAIQTGYADNPHARSAAWAKALTWAADRVCRTPADVDVVAAAFEKARAKMTATDCGAAGVSIDTARVVLGEAVEVEAEAVPA